MADVNLPNLDVELLKEVEQFLYREARYADEHAYDDWEALWTDDGVYWVPFGSDDADPETQLADLIGEVLERTGVRRERCVRVASVVPASALNASCSRFFSAICRSRGSGIAPARRCHSPSSARTIGATPIPLSDPVRDRL